MNKDIVAALSCLRVPHYCNCGLFCAIVLTHIFVFNQMVRVISTIKSLECVNNILQVNIKEDKEVVVPCSLFLVPCSLFLVPGSWFLVTGSWFLVP